MRILFLTSGREVPSTRFRILQYLPGLRARGHVCTVAHSVPPKYRGWPLIGNRASDVPRLVFRAIDALRAARQKPDVVVIERELFSSGIRAVERLFRKLAPALVLDVDDAVFVEHPDKFQTNAAMCDLVIAGNAALREHVAGKNSRVIEIPTCLDTDRYTVRPIAEDDAEPLVLGWTGTSYNLAYLREIAEPLRKLAQAHRIRLQIIAERPPSPTELDLEGLDVCFVPWSEESEIRDLHAFDVGLMPLEDTQWTRYKCGLKILQYMAVGIPAVASPVGVNSEIIEHGVNGYLASSADEWAQSLTKLCGDVELRRRIGAAGRKTVEERYSLDVWLPQLEQALVEAAGHASPPDSSLPD